MLVDKDFLRGIGKLVDQANEVSRLCSDEAVKWATDDFLAVDIHDRYMSWKEDVDLFLQVHDLPLDAKIFRVENSVPLMKGGLEYGDKESTESRGLIKAISLEMDEKLKHLRELVHRKSGVDKVANIIDGTLLFYFSEIDGLYRIISGRKEEYKLNPKEQRYKIVNGLRAKSFKSSKILAKEVGTTPELLRIQISGIKSMVQKKFKGVRGSDFIASSKGRGYRIGDKIKLQKI